METVGADAVVPPRRTWRARGRLWRARRRAHVRLAPDVRIGRAVVLRARLDAPLEVGAGAALGDGARLEASGGPLRVGAGAVVGERAALVGAVHVGRECVVGDWARLEGSARLDDRARLAAHAVALDGARVGAGAVVGSYATVDGAVRPRTVIGRATGTITGDTRAEPPPGPPARDDLAQAGRERPR